MVMWQVLIGRALKAWNNQLLGPARGSAVHAFLSKEKAEKKERFVFKTPCGKKPCSGFKMSDILVKQNTICHIHRVQRVRQKVGSCLCSRGTSGLKLRDQ